LAEIPVGRGQKIDASAVLVKIDNPETIAKNEQALAAKVVAEAHSPTSMQARARR
jgi:HlyD family secretion protein